MSNDISLTLDRLARYPDMRPELRQLYLEHAQHCDHPGTIWDINLVQSFAGRNRYWCSFCRQNFWLERREVVR